MKPATDSAAVVEDGPGPADDLVDAGWPPCPCGPSGVAGSSAAVGFMASGAAAGRLSNQGAMNMTPMGLFNEGSTMSPRSQRAVENMP